MYICIEDLYEMEKYDSDLSALFDYATTSTKSYCDTMLFLWRKAILIVRIYVELCSFNVFLCLKVIWALLQLIV